MTDANDEIAKAEARMERLREQLASAPVVDVLGVVSPSGVGGGNFPGEDFWTLRFTLDAWRIPGMELQTGALDLERKVTREELDRFQEALEPYMVVRIKARIVHESVLGNAQGLLEKFVRAETADAELNEKAADLQKPVTFADPVLGTFTLDRRVDCFEAQLLWLGKPVSLSLSATEPGQLQQALRAAHTLWQYQDGWTRRIGDFAVAKLLPLKNECWLDEDEAELTPKEFKARMTLEGVSVYPDGSFNFWHNDGDLFWGHAIQISGNLTDGPTDADIPG